MEIGPRRDFKLAESVVSPRLRTIEHKGRRVRIEPRAMRVLEVLARQPGEVVSKANLIEQVWGHAFVTDDVLTRCISCLRKALGDDARYSRIIETIPRTGYRLIGSIQLIEPDALPTLLPAPVPIEALRVPTTLAAGQGRRHGWRAYAGGWQLAGFLCGVMLLLWLTHLSGTSRRSVSERLSLHPDTRVTSRGGATFDPEARSAYLLGRYYWNQRTPASLQNAVNSLQRAVHLDPRYALAWVALADAYNVMPDWNALAPQEAFPRARQAALRALQLDSTLAEAHAALAYTLGNYDWKWTEAEREFQIALRLNPDYPSAHQWYAMQLASLSRFPQAIAEIRKAHQLDPTSPVIATDAAEILYAAGMNETAARQYREIIELDPHFAQAHAGLARVYERQGKYDEAVEELGKAAEASDDSTFGAALAVAYSRSGYVGTLHALISHELEGSGRYRSAAEIARLYTALGQKSAALEWLERARDDHDSCVVFLMQTSDFDSVRADARFTRILRVTGRNPAPLGFITED